MLFLPGSDTFSLGSSRALQNRDQAENNSRGCALEFWD